MEKTRVLYIEDEAEQRRSLCRLIRSKGFRITPASSGQIGLSLFKKRSFDVVLCDLNMPRMGGLKVLERMRRINPDIPVIILSSHGTIAQAIKSIKKGAFDFILEPPNIDEVVTTIHLAIEKTRLEKKLRESEASLRMIVENVPDIIYSLSPKGNFLRMSPSVKANMGYSPSELIGTSFFDLLHPDDRAQVQKRFLKAMKEAHKHIRTVEFRMMTKSGEFRHFEVRGRIITENGKAIKQDGIARDVTERKHYELELKNYFKELEKLVKERTHRNKELVSIKEQLEQKNAEMEKLLQDLYKSRDELQAILDTYPDVIIKVDQMGHLTTANKNMDDFFGVSSKDVLNKPFKVFLDKIKDSFEDFDRFLKITNEMLCCSPDELIKKEFDIAQMLEQTVRQIKPKERIILPINIPVFDRNKVILGSIWIYQDVTPIKRSYDQIHTIVNASPIPLLVSRISDGKILFVNDHLAKLVESTPKDLIGKGTPDFYYNPEDRKIVLEKLHKEGYVHNYEMQIIRPDKKVIWSILSIELTQIGDEQVAITGLYDIDKRRQAEEALKRERNFVSAVLDTVGALVVVLDTKGRIVRFNRTCEQVTGYKFAEVKDKPFWDIFLIPEEVKKVKGIFKELKAGHFPNKAENYWVTKDGVHRLIVWSNTALIDEDGAVDFIIGTGIDITEHREIEQALQESEKKYRELVESANSIIMRWDQNGYITFFNKYAQDFFGYKEKEILNKNVMETIVPETDSAGRDLRAMIEDIERNPSKYVSNENENIKKSGERVWITWTNKPIYDEEGSMKEILSIGKDDTERKKFEWALQESEERFRGLVENAYDIIYTLTPEGTFSYVSPNLKEILGFDVSDFEGESIWKFVQPKDIPICDECFQNMIMTSEKISGIEYRIRHKNKSWRWHRSSISPLIDSEGNVIYYIGIAHDFTRMKKVMDDLERANQYLKDAQAQLVQSEKMASLGALVAGIAHEINTPIGAVSSMQDTLFRTLENLRNNIRLECPKQVQEDTHFDAAFKIVEDSHKVIQTGTERVVNIVKRLRSFARLDEAELKTVDIHEGLEDTLTLAHHELKHKVTVIKKFGNIPPISCFPSELNQVFLNLLINSKQAIKEEGTITITTFAKNRKIHIIFEDNGSGIPKENLSKIFDPGFTTKGRGIGTGLGLSICYQIIQNHHGEIRVESELGKGTKFTINLPMNLDQLLEKNRKRN